jgi:hypothetical protein
LRAGVLGRRSWLLLSLALAACGPERIPRPPTPAPVVDNPTDAIPGDLDVVVRIDFERIRRTLGPELIADIRRHGAAGRDAGAEPLVAEAIERADTIWIALRPGDSAELSDAVVVFRGRYSGFDPKRLPADPPWSGPVDLGATWRLYERARPKVRSAPARVYARGEDLLVLVSTAEIDSVERTIERGAGGPSLAPPEKGAISIEARVPPIAERIADRSPAAAKLLSRARRLRASADLEAAGLKAELELEFELEEHARRAADAAGILKRAMAEQQTLAGSIARALEIDAVGSVLVVAIALPPEALARIVEAARR